MRGRSDNSGRRIARSTEGKDVQTAGPSRSFENDAAIPSHPIQRYVLLFGVGLQFLLLLGASYRGWLNDLKTGP